MDSFYIHLLAINGEDSSKHGKTFCLQCQLLFISFNRKCCSEHKSEVMQLPTLYLLVGVSRCFDSSEEIYSSPKRNNNTWNIVHRKRSTMQISLLKTRGWPYYTWKALSSLFYPPYFWYIWNIVIPAANSSEFSSPLFPICFFFIVFPIIG